LEGSPIKVAALTKPNIMTRKSQAKMTGMGIIAQKTFGLPDSDKNSPYAYNSNRPTYEGPSFM
jgi:hypothetical protein